jgi:integrase
MAYRTQGARLRITEALIDRAADTLAAHGSPDVLVVRDLDLKGFVLRLRASGRHVYGAAYGRGKFLTIGGSDRFTAGKARKAARDALAETSLTGAPVLAERKRAALTLKAFLELHYEPWAAEHLKTADETLARLRVIFASFLDTRLVDLTPFAIERWRTARLKAGKSKATVNRDLVALKAAVSKAVTWGYVKAHPLAPVKPYHVDARAVVRYLKPDEEMRLLAALATRDETRRQRRISGDLWRRERGYAERGPLGTYTDHLTPLVTVALHTGLRRGELFGLRWQDVDLTRAMLTVRGYGAKSGQTRHIPLNTTAVDTLKTWRSGRSKPAVDAPLVFPGADDGALEDIKKAWAGLMKAAALTDFRFHDLRHTFASKLVMAGVDLNTVRELLGHSDIKMTLRYAHLAPEAKAAAVAKLVQA